MSIASSFTTWLLTQQERADLIGDLARDVAQDSGWPSTGTEKQAFLAYLESRSVSNGALRAFDEAWAAWQQGT